MLKRTCASLVVTADTQPAPATLMHGHIKGRVPFMDRNMDIAAAPPGNLEKKDMSLLGR